MDKLRTRIHEGVGEASMCWVGGPGDRVFDSTLALDVADRLTIDVQALLGWKTIDSVPKDGTPVLLCKAIDGDGQPIDWRDSPASGHVQAAAWWEKEGWVVYCSMVQDPKLHFDPTHWMPLPAPPCAT